MSAFIKYTMVFIICALVPISFASTISSSEGIQVYSKNSYLSPRHKKRLADDIIRYRNADNLWDVLREQFTLAHYEHIPVVQDRIEWYMNNQEYILRSAARAIPYLYYILQEVKKRHLPAELVLLPIIESGYDPFSLSSMGAAGIWQLMPGTATGFGVKQDYWYDGRRDIIVSTKAALNYLAYLQSFFEGNWLLAFAAYNTGEGNVLTAIKKNIRDGKNTDFWSLPVAQQTKDYVPSILALATIIAHPEQYPIYFPPVRNAPYLAIVDVGRQINLKFAAALAGISYKKLMRLNPGYNRSLTSKSGIHKLILPIENIEEFSHNFGKSTLANHAQFKNNLINSLKIKEQQTRYFTTNNPALKYKLQPGDTIYMVRSNDTLIKIAKHFHLSKKMLQTVNQLRNNRLKSGDQLIIPTHFLARFSSRRIRHEAKA